MQTGYAAKIVDGSILVDTVSPTERGAEINWLCGYANYMVLRDHTDFEIAEKFNVYNAGRRVEIVEVQISEIQ